VTARPLPGLVIAVGSTGERFTVNVGRSGRFRLSVPAGSYRLAGYSPMARSNGTEVRCSAGRPVLVKADKISRDVHVGCLPFPFVGSPALRPRSRTSAPQGRTAWPGPLLWLG